jgi:serine/threonine-protein phosphatase 2A activator
MKPRKGATTGIMDSQEKGQISGPSNSLPRVESTRPHDFLLPSKRIYEGHDLPKFLTSRAYADIGLFVMQLNVAMCPRKEHGSPKVLQWQLDSSVPSSETVRKLQELLQKVDAIIEEAPPETGPRRFGNASFRKWYVILESRVRELLQMYLPANVLNFSSKSEEVSALDEVIPYFLGGFGSSQRLDYGTGHELSFLAFLGCIWKLGGFSEGYTQDGSLERSIVMGVIEPYVSTRHCAVHLH